MSNSEIRAKTREQLGQRIFATMWLTMVLVFLIYSVVLSAVSFTAIGAIILAGPLEYAVCRITVKVARGEGKVDFNDFLTGFKEDFAGVVLLGFLKAIFIFLWSLLFIIPGIIKSYAYSMSAYIQQDSENKDWNYCLTESVNRMKGYKMKLFLLDLSFIGWYLLGALCFGIGTLFVIPYHQQARANFYQEFIAGRTAETAGM